MTVRLDVVLERQRSRHPGRAVFQAAPDQESGGHDGEVDDDDRYHAEDDHLLIDAARQSRPSQAGRCHGHQLHRLGQKISRKTFCHSATSSDDLAYTTLKVIVDGASEATWGGESSRAGTCPTLA